jgi:hypothetical protein
MLLEQNDCTSANACSGERATAILPGTHATESKSSCAAPDRADSHAANVDFPEPELPRMAMRMDESTPNVPIERPRQALRCNTGLRRDELLLLACGEVENVA